MEKYVYGSGKACETRGGGTGIFPLLLEAILHGLCCM